MAESVYPINNEINVTGTFKDSADAVYAPAAVKVDVIKPNNSSTTLTYPTDDADHAWANPSTGVYTITILDADVAGRWRIVFYDPTSGQKVKDVHTFVIKAAANLNTL